MSTKNVTTGKSYDRLQDAGAAVNGPGQKLEVGGGAPYVFVDHETLPVLQPKTEVYAAAGATPSLTKTSALEMVTILDVKKSAVGAIITGLRLYGHGPFFAATLDEAVDAVLNAVHFYGDNGLRITKARNVTLNDIASDPTNGYGIYVGGGVIPVDPATKLPSRRLEDQPWTDGLTLNRPSLSRSIGQHPLRIERGKNIRVNGGSITGMIDPTGPKNVGLSVRTAIGVWVTGTALNCVVHVGPKPEDSGDIRVEDVHFDQINMGSGHFDLFDGHEGCENVSITNSTLKCSGTTGACISIAQNVKNVVLQNLQLDHVYPGAVWLKGDRPDIVKKDCWFRGKRVA